MKPESLAMVEQYRNLFQPIIERGGYITDKTNSWYQMDPVNFIIPGLIRVAEGDIEGVPAGDYPLDTVGQFAVNGSSANNSQPLANSAPTLSLSENIKILSNTAFAGFNSLQSLLLPSTLETGNIGQNFSVLGNNYWQDLDTPTDRATWSPDGPRATGLGTQPTDKPVNPSDITGVTTSSILYELYYPLTMPYYLKQYRK